MLKKQNMTKYYKFSLYLLIIVLINLVGLNLFFRLDLTKNGLYSLSKASKQAVSTLREPLTLNVFFTKNLPAPYNNTERYLHDLLEEYSLHGKEYFNYRFYDVNAKEGDLSEKAEENRNKAQDYGIYPVNVQTIEQDEAKVQRAYMGIAFIHGDIIERIPSLTSTENLEYKITSTIQKMNNKISALLNLSDKITVKLIQSSALEQIAAEIGLEGLQDLRAAIAGIIEEQNLKTYDQLKMLVLDPSREELSAADMAKYNRFGLQWPELKKPDGTVIAAGTGILALGLEFGTKSFETRLLTQSLNLTDRGLQEQFQIIESEQIKSFIEENVDNLISIHDEIGYLASHGTEALASSLPPQFQMMQQQPQSNLTKFNALVSSSYSITQVQLGQEEIPENIDTLIIAGPKENFSDWELFQIDQFLMKGKSLALFIDSFNEIQPQQQQQMYGMQQPVFLPINSGLEKLLNHYGIETAKSIVLDESSFVSRDPNAGEMQIYYAPIIKNENINNRLDFMKNIKELILIQTSPLHLDEEKIKENGLEALNIFSSSRNSWEMSGRINLNPYMIRPPMNPEEKRSFDLAYLLTGEFPSYFAGKEAPEKPKPEPEADAESEAENEAEKAQPEPEVQESQVKSSQNIISKGRPGKIFLIGTAKILNDNVIDDQGASPNAVFLLNTIDFLNNKADIAAMRSKNQRFNPLNDTKAFTRTFVKLLNIVGLPALVILAGFFIWFKRKARRKMIQTIFTKATQPMEKK